MSEKENGRYAPVSGRAIPPAKAQDDLDVSRPTLNRYGRNWSLGRKNPAGTRMWSRGDENDADGRRTKKRGRSASASPVASAAPAAQPTSKKVATKPKPKAKKTTPSQTDAAKQRRKTIAMKQYDNAVRKAETLEQQSQDMLDKANKLKEQINVMEKSREERCKTYDKASIELRFSGNLSKDKEKEYKQIVSKNKTTCNKLADNINAKDKERTNALKESDEYKGLARNKRFAANEYRKKA